MELRRRFSWANGWYFLIACEIIVAGKAQYDLPGLGSMLSRSLARGDLALATGALLTLVALVVAIEFVVWRPLRTWSRRFRYDTAQSDETEEPEFHLPDLGIPALLRPARALVRSLGERLPIARVNRVREQLGRGAVHQLCYNDKYDEEYNFVLITSLFYFSVGVWE